MFKIIALSLLLIGIFSFIKGFTKLQIRDKRFNKGIKKKFNFLSLFIFIFSFICLYMAYRFYYFSN